MDLVSSPTTRVVVTMEHTTKVSGQTYTQLNKEGQGIRTNVLPGHTWNSLPKMLLCYLLQNKVYDTCIDLVLCILIFLWVLGGILLQYNDFFRIKIKHKKICERNFFGMLIFICRGRMVHIAVVVRMLLRMEPMVWRMGVWKMGVWRMGEWRMGVRRMGEWRMELTTRRMVLLLKACTE